MKIVIDIPKEMILSLEQGSFGAKYNMYDLIGCVMNGTPLPKGHGDLIDRKDLIENGISKGFCDWYDEIKMADTIIEADDGSE